MLILTADSYVTTSDTKVKKKIITLNISIRFLALIITPNITPIITLWKVIGKYL